MTLRESSIKKMSCYFVSVLSEVLACLLTFFITLITLSTSHSQILLGVTKFSGNSPIGSEPLRTYFSPGGEVSDISLTISDWREEWEIAVRTWLERGPRNDASWSWLEQFFARHGHRYTVIQTEHMWRSFVRLFEEPGRRAPYWRDEIDELAKSLREKGRTDKTTYCSKKGGGCWFEIRVSTRNGGDLINEARGGEERWPDTFPHNKIGLDIQLHGLGRLEDELDNEDEVQKTFTPLGSPQLAARFEQGHEPGQALTVFRKDASYTESIMDA